MFNTICLHYLLSCVFLIIVLAEWKPIDNACLCKEFRCNNGTACLHADRVCNGYKDCADGEDEINNLGPNGKCRRVKSNCSSDEFKCKFGDCIDVKLVCDGTIHCLGGVDEATDLCTWLNS